MTICYFLCIIGKDKLVSIFINDIILLSKKGEVNDMDEIMENVVFDESDKADRNIKVVSLADRIKKPMIIVFIMAVIACAIQFIGSDVIDSKVSTGVIAAGKGGAGTEVSETIRSFSINMNAYFVGGFVFLMTLFMIDVRLIKDLKGKYVEEKVEAVTFVVLLSFALLVLFFFALDSFRMVEPDYIGAITRFAWPIIVFINFLMFVICTKAYK